MTWICPKCRTRYERNVQRCPHDKRRIVEDLTGHVIAGRYTLKELLGIGGMDSSVWMAIQAPIHRPVAIKLLPPAEGDNADRFARGARIASNLNHPNITVVHDYGRTADGKLFLVMELLEGRELHEILRSGPLGIERALSITDQVLKALDHAHRKNVVHRDIKPGNLFLTKNEADDTEFVKVLDFGIARFIDPNDSFTEEPGQEITTTRQICGTPQYMAPEQIAMGKVDGRTDLYALGVVLYRMLTGVLPFRTKDHRELFRAHLTQIPPSFTEARANIDSPDLEALVMRALAKSPDDRFASPAEMRRAIRQLRSRMGGLMDDEMTPMSGTLSAPHSMPSQNMTVSITEPKRNVWAPLLVLLIVLGGLGVFIWMQMDQGDPIAKTPLSAASVPTATPATTATAAAAVADAAPVSNAKDAGVAKVVDAAPPPAPDAAPPSAAQTGQARITSVPRGAKIRLDGKTIGRTPTTVTLPVGTHRLELARGRKVSSLTVTITADGKVSKFHAALRAPSRRAPATEAPKPKSVPTAAPPTVEAVATPTKAPKVRMKLLDEDTARDFDVKGGKDGKPASPATRKPDVKLLDP